MNTITMLDECEALTVNGGSRSSGLSLNFEFHKARASNKGTQIGLVVGSKYGSVLQGQEQTAVAIA